MSTFFNKLLSSMKETTTTNSSSCEEKEQPPDDEDDEQQQQSQLMTQRPEDAMVPGGFETQEEPINPLPPYLAAAAKLQPSNNNSRASRLRSISRVFTPLPPKLPSYQQMLMDIVEYWCHVCMLETVPEKLMEHKTQLEAAMDDLKRNTQGQSKSYLRKGRLYSRLQLTNLTIDMCLLRVDGTEEEEEEDSDDENNQNHNHIPDATDMNQEHWTTFKERLILVKSIMLKKNCNVMPAEGESLKADEYPDRELAVHDMMNSAYNHVHTLLDVQIALSTLRHDLETIAEDCDNNSDTESRAQNIRVERAVSRYIANLKTIFVSPDEEHENDDEDGGGDAQETERIPSHLNNFLLHDMYRSPSKKAVTKHGLAHRLLDKIRAIQIDSKTPPGSLPGTYSFANVQQKMHSLLLKWTESILEIPTLVKLGYGEVISPVIETEDDDDVSSFGNNHEENDTKIQQDELNPHMTQLSFQSIERLCRAARGSNIALTDKEKAIIERINTKRQRSSCSDNNSYPIASGCKESIPDTNVTNVATETILEEFQETSNNIRMNEEKKRTEEQTMQTSSFQKDTRHGIIVADEVDSVTRKTSNSNSKAALKFIPSRAPLRPNNHKTSRHAFVSTGGDKNEEDDSSDDEDEPVVVRYSKRIAIWACPDDVPGHKMQRKL